MTSRTRQQWRELFKQQAAGDLSVAEFCKEHAIGPSYFYKRKSDLTIKKDARSTANFIKVKPQPKIIPQLSSIKLQHQHTRLMLPVSISPSWLAEFIKALA